MFIFKNALISITRNKGRNILIGIIILVIAAASTITLAINNTASDLINSYQSAYDKELTISFNRENMTKDIDFSKREKLDDVKEKFNNISSYTISDVENFANSDYIESYYYTYNISLNGNNIEKATSEDSSKSSNMPSFPGGGMGKNFGGSSYDFTLNGYSSLDAMSEFIEGTYEMVEIADDAWDKAFDGNYAFINEELASYNSLGLGSTLNSKTKMATLTNLQSLAFIKKTNLATPARWIYSQVLPTPLLPMPAHLLLLPAKTAMSKALSTLLSLLKTMKTKMPSKPNSTKKASTKTMLQKPTKKLQPLV